MMKKCFEEELNCISCPNGHQIPPLLIYRIGCCWWIPKCVTSALRLMNGGRWLWKLLEDGISCISRWSRLRSCKHQVTLPAELQQTKWKRLERRASNLLLRALPESQREDNHSWKRSLSVGNPGQAHGKLPTWRRPRKSSRAVCIGAAHGGRQYRRCNCRVEKVAEVEEKGTRYGSCASRPFSVAARTGSSRGQDRQRQPYSAISHQPDSNYVDDWCSPNHDWNWTTGGVHHGRVGSVLLCQEEVCSLASTKVEEGGRCSQRRSRRTKVRGGEEGCPKMQILSERGWMQEGQRMSIFPRSERRAEALLGMWFYKALQQQVPRERRSSQLSPESIQGWKKPGGCQEREGRGWWGSVQSGCTGVRGRIWSFSWRRQERCWSLCQGCRKVAGQVRMGRLR